MYRFTEESKTQIREFVELGYIGDDIYASLWASSSKHDIIKSFKEQLSLNEFNVSKIWGYIANNVWEDMSDIFEPNEIMLLKHLINSEGIVTLTYARRTLMNNYFTGKAVITLKEKKIIVVLDLESKEKIIILHPQFRFNVFGNGENGN